MTRKHFIVIAEALKSEKPGSNWSSNKHVQWGLDCRAICKALANMNPSFKPLTFLEACTVPAEVIEAHLRGLLQARTSL